MKSILLKLLPLGFILCYCTNLSAQVPESSFEVKPSSEFLNKKKEILKRLLYSDDTGHYALFASGRYGDGKKSIRKFSLDFQPTKYRVNIGFPKRIFEPETLKIAAFGNTLYHFWTTRTREGIDYYAQEIDLASQKVNAQKMIARVDYKKGYATRTKSNVIIDNSSKQLFLFSKVIHSQQETVAIRIDSYDKNLEQIATENYTLPYNNEQFEIVTVKPYDDGRIILIGKNYFSRNIVKSTKRKEYEYHIYDLVNGKPILLKTITLENKHLNTIVSKIVDEHLIISGFLAEHSLSKPSSIYFLKYNLKTSQSEAEKRNRLPDSFYRYPENRDEKIGSIQLGFRNKKKEADSNYHTQEIFINDKKEFIITAEQNFFIENNAQVMNGQGMMTPAFGRKVYFSSDIAVIKLNKDGELIWHSKIIKRQQWGGDKNLLSHYPALKDDKLFLFYNGNYLNLENPGSNFLNKNDSALICTVINNDGSFQRNVISYYTEEYPNVILPGLSNYNSKYGAVLYHRAPGNLKRQKFTPILLR